MQILRRNLLQAGLGASLLPTLSNSYAQSIDLARIVSGFPAGSSIDALGRVVAKKLIPDYARNVIVDTRPGAAGQIAVQAMKSASSDGSTILLTPMTVLGVYPHTYKSLPYDPVADLTPVSNGVTFNYGLAVGAGVPASITSIPQLMEWFKENPSKASLGNLAVGSTLHFAGMLLGRAANVDLTYVGYVNGGSMFNDVAGGVLPACISTLGSMMSFHNSGKLRIIGTTGAKRSAFLPNIPTFVEVGYKDLVFKEWIGFFFPARTSQDLVLRLNTRLAAALTSKDATETLNLLAMEATPSSPAELVNLLRNDSDLWRQHVKEVGFTSNS